MWSSESRIRVLIVVVLITAVEFTAGQNVLLPRPEVEDPFKDNPKWDEFKLIQGERIARLKTLVNNVWNLVDNIAIMGDKFSFKESFIRFHFRAFQNFFLDSRNRLHDGNPFSIINPAIGLRKIANLFQVANFNPSDPLNEFRAKWAEVDSLTLIIHQVFNKTADQIVQTAGGGATGDDKLFDISQAYPVNCSGGGDDNATAKSMTLDEIATKINDEMTGLGSDKHLLRGLVQILRNIKQSNVYTDAYINFFCYGNNEFGIIPELLDLLSDAALHLIIADMEKLVLDVYSNALPILSNDTNAKIKDTLPQRNAIWDTMISRLNTKYNFTYLDGKGWGSSAAPAIFKCDSPPETAGQKGQWGRNLTTGATPAASLNFVYDPQTGSYTTDGVVGYFDDRSPVIRDAVGFDNAFQGYLESELVLSQITTASCAGTCVDYSHPTKTCDGNDNRCEMLRSQHCEPGTRNCLEQSKCPSFARKCIRAAKSVTICPSTDPAKRYDWLRLNEQVFKRSNVSDTSECLSGPTSNATEKWEIENSLIMSAPQYCELCLCVCMSSKSKEDQMYFDIQPAVADVAAGKIISAVRFIKEGNVIRLAVEHGTPSEKGMVDESTLSWVEPLPFDKADVNKTVPVGVEGFLKINIDLIIGDAGTVLTGVRFRRIQNDTLGLEIQTTPISWPESDPKQISLKSAESTWKGVDSESIPREPVTFWKAGNPAFQLGPSMPDSILNSFVEFTTTSFEQDLAQTVIPFFDTQPVHYYDGRHWLRGVGVIHKGKPGSGGFMAPLIVPARPYTAIRYFPVPQSQ